MKMKSSSPHQGSNSVGVISIRKEVVYLERKGENQVKANSTWEKRKKKTAEGRWEREREKRHHPLMTTGLVHPMSLLPLKAGRPLNASAIYQRTPALQVQGL